MGSPDMARNTVNVVIEAPMPTAIAAIMSVVSTRLRRRLLSPSRK